MAPRIDSLRKALADAELLGVDPALLREASRELLNLIDTVDPRKAATIDKARRIAHAVTLMGGRIDMPVLSRRFQLSPESIYRLLALARGPRELRGGSVKRSNAAESKGADT